MSRTPRRRAPSTRSARSAAKDKTNSGERLQKVLAAAGVGSRRECEQWITDGRVEVDRQIVTKLGTRVDPSKQEIRVDGARLRIGRRVVYLVNKPAGVVCTNRDPDGRTRVVDLVPSEQRLFTVGRLDRTSEGLILVTNDGELANRMTHPRYGIPKCYRAKVLGYPTAQTLKKLRDGVHLAEGVARVKSVKSKSRHARGSELEIVLTEGRNREIRRILARVGHKVLHLRRIALGPLRLGTVPTGEWRRLTATEVDALRRAAASDRPSGRRTGSSGKPRPGKTGQGAAPRRSRSPATRRKTSPATRRKTSPAARRKTRKRS